MKKFEKYLEMAVKIRDNVLPEISEEDFLAFQTPVWENRTFEREKELTLNISNIKVYPNPVDDYLKIEINNQSRPIYIVDIVLFSANGVEIIKYNNIQQRMMQIYLKDMPSGLYYLKINDSQGQYFYSKIVKI